MGGVCSGHYLKVGDISVFNDRIQFQVNLVRLVLLFQDWLFILGTGSVSVVEGLATCARAQRCLLRLSVEMVLEERLDLGSEWQAAHVWSSGQSLICLAGGGTPI